MKQATFSYIAAQLLTKQEKEKLAKIFKDIDVNGDGKLSKEEIMNGFDKYFNKTMNEEEVDKMFESVDTDNSGFIDYSEFIVAAMNEKNLLTNDKLEAAFKMFDKDGSGLITPDEIKEVLGKGGNLPEEALNEIIKQVDDNGDGEISFEEFAQMMKNLTV
jgi:calcium-dependent protein kinase